MDLNSLVIFAKVAEASSFSEAARRLKMPLATVSRRIAELEEELNVRLLERSTRNLRLTEIGAEVLEQAQRSGELSRVVDNIVSNHQSRVAGLLGHSAPPSVSDSLLAPLVGAFQVSYPDVRVQVLVTNRMIDHIADGVDLAFRLGPLKDSTLVARRLLTYRHQLVASPEYLKRFAPPANPQDLLQHRLLTFFYSLPEATWAFEHVNGKDKESVTFRPYLTMNDFAGLAPALRAGVGIGELPPIVNPELVRSGQLVEVMPEWHLRSFDFSMVHLGNRHMARPVRVFKEFAAQFTPTLFPTLPA